MRYVVFPSNPGLSGGRRRDRRTLRRGTGLASRRYRRHDLAPAAGRTILRFSAPPVLETNAVHPELSGVRFSPELPVEAAADSSPETDLTDDFALEVTCRPDAVDHYRTILWKGDRSVKPERIAYYLSIHDGKLEFKFKDAAGEWCVFSTPEAVIAPGLWHRIAVQVKNGRPAFSVDGRLLPSGDGYAGRAPLKRLESNRDKLYIGRGRAGAMPAYGFCGVIGSVRLTAPAAKTVLRTSSGDRLRRLGIRDDFERESARLRRLEPLMKAGPGSAAIRPAWPKRARRSPLCWRRATFPPQPPLSPAGSGNWTASRRNAGNSRDKPPMRNFSATVRAAEHLRFSPCRPD